MADPAPDRCPAARHADLALLVVTCVVCFVPFLGLVFNAVAPVHLRPLRKDAAAAKGWYWCFPAVPGRANDSWQNHWRQPRAAAEHVCLPRWMMSQWHAWDQQPDWRNLSMCFARRKKYPTASLEVPRRPKVKSTLKKFVNHRFGGRASFMRLGAWLKLYPLGVSSSEKVILGRDDWLFYRSKPSLIDDLRGVHRIPADDLRVAINALQANHDHLAALGIPYVLVICPSKANIYPEKRPGWLQDSGGPSAREQFLAAVADTDLEVLDLTETCRTARDEEWQAAVKAALRRDHPDAPIDWSAPLESYQRCDTHWSDVGAFRAYRAIASHLRERHLPRLKVMGLDDVTVRLAVKPSNGDLTTFLYRKGDPRYQDHLVEIIPPDATGGIDEGNLDPFYETGTRDPAMPKAVILRDSFCQRLIPYLSQHFGLVRYRWSNQLLTRHEVVTVEMPRWLADADRSLVARLLRAQGQRGPFVLRPGDGACWRFTEGRQHLSLDIEMGWLQVRGDRPDIVIQEFSERWLAEDPRTFDDFLEER